MSLMVSSIDWNSPVCLFENVGFYLELELYLWLHTGHSDIRDTVIWLLVHCACRCHLTLSLPKIQVLRKFINALHHHDQCGADLASKMQSIKILTPIDPLTPTW